jgi:hypothetical protein
MATTWVTVAKLAGPVVGELRRLFRRWIERVDARCSAVEQAYRDVREQVLARGARRRSGYKVSTSEEYRSRIEAIGNARYYGRTLAEMSELQEAIEAHADRPPIVFFRKYVDPWTIGAGYSTLSELATYEGSTCGQVLAPFLSAVRAREGWSGPELGLFSVADRAGWMRTLEGRLAELHGGNRDRPCDWFERRQFYQALAEGTVSWEKLLEDRGVETAIFLAFRSVDGCWLDEEVAEASRVIPAWYAGFGPSAPDD